jgi:hypothetical protein
MSKIYQSEIAEKILLRNEDLTEFSGKNYFKIGGKILFEDLSILKYINNLNFIERTQPINIEDFEYKDFTVDKVNLNAEELNNNLWGLQDKRYKEKALILIPTPQERAEGDYEFIVVFKNGEASVRSLSSGDYSYYDKNETDSLLYAFGLDHNLISKKLEKDFEIDNNLVNKKKSKPL